MSILASGNLKKLSPIINTPILYTLPIGEEKIALNPLLGQVIQLEYLHTIHCIQCGRKTAKSFQQGYCFPCYKRLMECNLCMIHPERCRFHEGTCQTDDWVHASCGQPHIVYLANSSHAKVGITRETNVPNRWIDQGATQAMPIIRVLNRYHSGLVEVAFKNVIADKTHWQTMLKAASEPLDLVSKRDEIFATTEQAINSIKQQFGEGAVTHLDSPMINLHYPILQYPTKVKGLDFHKTPIISGTLLGIKGQYLILDIGVINIRKFSGYAITLSV
jgi:hypothetical protein